VRGGNSRFTAGALRFVYNGIDDLLKLCDLSETELATSDFGTIPPTSITTISGS
jgi:tricarballylate dehydrogenase